MSFQSSRVVWQRKHDWCTGRSLQTLLWHTARYLHNESQHAARKSHWTGQSSDYNFKVQGRQRAREKLADKEFFLSLLSAATTKREAKAYLSRFPSVKTSKHSVTRHKQNSPPEAQPGVNLGSFYGATRSVLETPLFRQGETHESQRVITIDEALHVALVKLANPQSIDDETMHGVALTLSQLTRLGMASCVVIDPGLVQGDERQWREIATEQADRLSTAIDACDGGKALRLDAMLIKHSDKDELPKVVSRQALLRPLRKNNTIVVTPVVYSEQTSKASLISATDAMLALTRELAGLERKHDPDEDPLVTAQKFAALQKEVVVDRLIVLDPLGGIPAFRGPQRSHVFINMEQEFEDIENELQEQQKDQKIGPFNGHLDNLRLLKQALMMLPPLSSGIITTPLDVAMSACTDQQDATSVSQVGTRRQKNTLIHNLLTDKPIYSSSLPSARLGPTTTPDTRPIPPLVQSTFVKRGMPLTILPDPRHTPWSPYASNGHRITLDDPRIDLPRLVHLIEDSFDRKLDVHDYLDRINDRIAGLIIAGEYEGGAILTWETPPSIPESERNKPENLARLVPYLDKFAVLKRSQGAGGVADVVFNAMVRTCLPSGVCWRSRMDNPVNKWYFERSRGTWKLNGSNWAMFWTTPGVPEHEPVKFRDYEAVCRNIRPSWADKKSVVD